MSEGRRQTHPSPKRAGQRAGGGLAGPMHVHDLARACEGAVSGLARCGTWLSARVPPQRDASARAKAPWRQVPELFERLRRLTHRRDGGRLVGIVAPDLARVGYPCAQTMGKAGAVAVRERVRLNSAGVMKPFLGRLLRLQFIRLSRMLTTEPARWWRAKGEDGAPNLRASVRSTGRPTLAEFGEI